MSKLRIHHLHLVLVTLGVVCLLSRPWLWNKHHFPARKMWWNHTSGAIRKWCFLGDEVWREMRKGIKRWEISPGFCLANLNEILMSLDGIIGYQLIIALAPLVTSQFQSTWSCLFCVDKSVQVRMRELVKVSTHWNKQEKLHTWGNHLQLSVKCKSIFSGSYVNSLM